jgi:hypothetical protein
MFYGGPVLRTIGVVGFGVMNLLRSGGVAEGHLQHGRCGSESYRYLCISFGGLEMRNPLISLRVTLVPRLCSSGSTSTTLASRTG